MIAFKCFTPLTRSAIGAIASCFATVSVLAEDWPQWLGPNRDGVWNESGTTSELPSDVSKIELWRKPIGFGYAGPAVAKGKVYVMDYQMTGGKIVNNPGNRDKLEGQERVLCYDAKTGELLWEHAYDRLYSLSYAAGPRCTPAVSDGNVYVLGAEGDLWCLNADSGKKIWHKQLQKEYKTRSGMWGFCGHPLVDGDTLFCLVGGKGSVAVAFDKNTGEEKWRALDAPDPGYCPPVMIDRDGQKQLLIWHPQALNGLDPATGKVQWQYPLKPAYDMSCASPRISGDQLFVSAIGKVGVLLNLAKDGSKVDTVWKASPKQAVFCSNSTPFFDGKTIYGCDVESSKLIAVNADNGDRHWETTSPVTGSDDSQFRHGTAFLVKNHDHFFIFSETGELITAKLSPKEYKEISRTKVLEPTNEAFGRKVVWNHPAFADKCVFVRNDKEIVCLNLAE